MQLIEDLIINQTIKTPALVSAFRCIKRKNFLPRDAKKYSEEDTPLSIGFGQTNSQPATVALMMELLQPQQGLKILDVGCGSGWSTAILAYIAGEEGRVYGIDIIKELTDQAKDNISKYGYLKNGIVQIFCTDGYNGLSQHAYFDRILVSAASEEIPKNLKQQLSIGGTMVIPVGRQGFPQDMYILKKTGVETFEYRVIPGFSFVPLVTP
jgi:protein-L-isoaspartate(D-aspartate) O-methyltransferase